MRELEIVIIISFILLILIYVVIRNHYLKNNQKIEVIEKEHKEKVAEKFYSTMKPKDYNDKQELTKYNNGTYRNEKGRYASLKK
tara:strand:- start:6262 stop:6513 length:252 start_codon:yes stop_codon:yes gene_type:complete